MKRPTAFGKDVPISAGTFLCSLLLLMTLVLCNSTGLACCCTQEDYWPYLDLLPAEFVFFGQDFKLAAPFSVSKAEWDGSLNLSTVTRNHNLKRWAEYLKTSPLDAEEIVYGGNYASWLSPEVDDYLRFIHDTEHLVDKKHYSSRREAGDYEYLTALTTAQSRIAYCNDDFLRLRWLFVAMRLAHYANFFDIENELFNEYSGGFSSETLAANSEVWSWIKALRAGQMQKTSSHPQDRAKASFLFAEVFRDSRTKWDIGLQGFWIRSDEEWAHLLVLCKDQQDIALMHYLRATQDGSFTLVELEKIVEVAPESELAPVLLANEIRYAHSISAYYSIDPVIPEPWREEYYERFGKILDALGRNPGFKDPFLVTACKLYLDFFSGNKIGTANIDEIISMFPEDPRVSYLSSLRLAAFVYHLDRIYPETESRLESLFLSVDELVPTATADLVKRFVLGHLSEIYAGQGNLGKSLSAKFCQIYAESPLTEPQLDLYLAFAERESHSAFENRLLKMDHLTHENASWQKIYHLLGSHRLDLAVDMLKKMGGGARLEYDPFATGVRRNNREKATMAKGRQNILSCAMLIQNLHSVIENDDTEAWAHLRLANAYFNASAYGNSSYYLRGSLNELPYSSFDLATAKYYYDNTLAVTKNDELRAEALHGLAKIAFATEDSVQNPGRFFQKALLMRHTKYFQEIIQECAVFKSGNW